MVECPYPSTSRLSNTAAAAKSPLTKEASGSDLSGDARRRPEDPKEQAYEYVRLAAAGETVLITDRDAVVAEIGTAAPRPQSDACRCHA